MRHRFLPALARSAILLGLFHILHAAAPELPLSHAFSRPALAPASSLLRGDAAEPLELLPDPHFIRNSDGSLHRLNRKSSVAGFPADAEILLACKIAGRADDFTRYLTRRVVVLDLNSPDTPRLIELANPTAALEFVADLKENHPEIAAAAVLTAWERQRRALPDDPLLPQQWNLVHAALSSTLPTVQLRMEPAWRFSTDSPRLGAGVRIAIVDDGVQGTHPDLAPNFLPALSYDFVRGLTDAGPVFANDSHGTACAGLAAARGANRIGISGTAPQAGLVSIRLLAGPYDDSKEAAAFSHRNDVIQIKSNSWGPTDDGSTLDGPGPLARAALSQAAASGRNGLGTLILWAAGNGAALGDQSNKDGYAASTDTITVSALDSLGRIPGYAEAGSNVLISVPSSGAPPARELTTTDRTGSDGLAIGDYHSAFTATSACPPQLAGVIAMMLEAQPTLNRSQIQEILLRSCVRLPVGSDGWLTNRAGFSFHTHAGAGLLNAASALAFTENPPVFGASTSASSIAPLPILPLGIPEQSPSGTTIDFDLSDSNVRIEQVALRFTARHSARGNLCIDLVSPSGTVSRLVNAHGDTRADYTDWEMKSVQFWGEPANGIWQMRIADVSRTGNSTGGTLESASLRVLGTAGSYATWIETLGSAADRAPGADPDSDGVPNLIEYSLGTDPGTAASTQAPVVRPIPGTLAFDFDAWIPASDLTRTLEWATNPAGPWTDQGVTTTARGLVGGTRTFRAILAPHLASEPRLFVRLRVTRAEVAR